MNTRDELIVAAREYFQHDPTGMAHLRELRARYENAKAAHNAMMIAEGSR